MPGHNEGAVRAVVIQYQLDDDQRNELRRAIEREKETSSRGGSDNLSLREIEDIAKTLFQDHIEDLNRPIYPHCDSTAWDVDTSANADVDSDFGGSSNVGKSSKRDVKIDKTFKKSGGYW